MDDPGLKQSMVQLQNPHLSPLYPLTALYFTVKSFASLYTSPQCSKPSAADQSSFVLV